MTTKELILVPVGGIGNRIHAVCSAIQFAQDFHLSLTIYWFRDWGMGARFEQLYTLNPSFKSFVRVVEASLPRHFLFDRPRKRNFWLTKPIHSLLFDFYLNEQDVLNFKIETLIDWASNPSKKCGYLVQYTDFYSNKFANNYITLSPDIQKVVDSKIDELGEGKKVGIHIRRSDHLLSIQQSPLELFIEKIEGELKSDKSTTFYLATDDEATKAHLKSLYPSKISTASSVASRGCDSGIIEAMVELYILSRMDRIYGSFNSTFSQLAAEIGHNKLHVVRTPLKP